MTYDEALAFWYGRIDYERRQPRPGDLKLDRMRALLRRLGDPHDGFAASTSPAPRARARPPPCSRRSCGPRAIAPGCSPRRTCRTSPSASRSTASRSAASEIAARMGEVAAAVQELDAEGDPTRSPTFFEVITALGFLHFDCRRVDVAVLEVGLGGRFDSTNVCEPLVSVITNVSLDHMAILGDTLEEIAYQKAGIIKRRVPVVTTADHPDVVAVIEREAAEHHATVTRIGRDFDGTATGPEAVRAGPGASSGRGRGTGAASPLGLFGEHQAANAAAACRGRRRIVEGGPAHPRSGRVRRACRTSSGRPGWNCFSPTRSWSSTAPTTSRRPGRLVETMRDVVPDRRSPASDLRRIG